MIRTLVGAGLLLTLTGCLDGPGPDAGGDGLAEPDYTGGPTAAGLYKGLTNNGEDVVGAVLENGDYFFLYSADAGDTFTGGIEGAFIGRLSATNSDLESSDDIDFNLDGAVLSYDLGGAYTSGQALMGEVNYDTEDADFVRFTTDYDDQFDQSVSLSDVAGEYTGDTISRAREEAAAVIVEADGTLSGIDALGCTLSGTIAARPNSNLFDIAFTYEPASTNDCPDAHAGQGFEGWGYVDDQEQALVMVAQRPDDREVATFFIGQP
ncbi:hypothetical protein C8D92_101256 [Tamilnaduibacter salinus]|uniref:Uncharacterized protein n=1 Tax=Tamilnaduibacter salinus TaxID=1484056 RepID=A0A2A2I1K5_9GAMM|nr:hypothetical protein [Tamilnaduibacter salinus]PAV25186.1 hypothetical protein CF392_12290 [Tamilnaduibacter salinus]PVY79050.1 hypothetical protein C8D92_101256 [Tamilnaduibacter salinus]